METIGTSLPRKWRDIFDAVMLETSPDANQSDAIAAGIFMWMCLEPEDRLNMLEIAHDVRRNWANDC